MKRWLFLVACVGCIWLTRALLRAGANHLAVCSGFISGWLARYVVIAWWLRVLRHVAGIQRRLKRQLNEDERD